MKLFYDCEFLEDGRTIDLISIGMVAEDGRELYLVNTDAPWKHISEHGWLMANVVPHLPPQWDLVRNKPKMKIADAVRAFILAGPNPELWAWYAAYDHVALCQLWGSMVDLPLGIPKQTNDLKQEAVRQGNPRLPDQPAGEHDALADARHNLVRARALGILL